MFKYRYCQILCYRSILQTPCKAPVGINIHKLFSSNTSNTQTDDEDPIVPRKENQSKSYKRVWKCRSTNGTEEDPTAQQSGDTVWNQSISEMDNETIQGILERIGMQVS
jgi:hypothetical protein